MSYVSLIIVLTGATWTLYVGWPLYRNWRQARQTNLPLMLSPISTGGLAWRILRSALARGLLPGCVAEIPFIRMLQGGWNFRDKFAIHQIYGEGFVFVTPSSVVVVVADVEAARQILGRRNDFPKPRAALEFLDVFGKNLATAEGVEWQRHRKLTSRAFHDRMYMLVWEQSVQFASGLLQQWTGSTQAVRTTQPDMERLSLNVLFRAFFNVERKEISLEQHGIVPTDVSLAQESLKNYLRCLTQPVPKQSVDVSREALGAFIRRQVEEKKMSSNADLRPDFLSSILSSAGHNGFSHSDVTGNAFLFIFAGHETTANTLTYIIYLLAIFPAWQDWAIQEVDEIFHDQGDDHRFPDWSDAYPRLTKFRAILYETLRLYGPVPTIVRQTNYQEQNLLISDRYITIPKQTPVNINAIALHTNPEDWGPESLIWNPRRWIQNEATSSSQTISQELLKKLLAWGDGPRVCPGKKFSQVEILAVLLSVFRSHRVRIVPQYGEDANEARLRARRLVENSAVRLTLQMQQPESVALEWVKR